MTEKELLARYDTGETIKGGSPEHAIMHQMSARVRRYLSQLNDTYHDEKEIIEIMEKITGQKVDETFRLFTPFYTDCGRNIHLGKNDFINACCQFQDQGGIYLGDGVLIGHGVMLLTLNHGKRPEERQDMTPRPIHIGNNVWIGSGSIVLPGVTIGDNAIIGAGSLVNRDVPADMIAVGSPARVIKSIYD